MQDRSLNHDDQNLNDIIKITSAEELDAMVRNKLIFNTKKEVHIILAHCQSDHRPNDQDVRDIACSLKSEFAPRRLKKIDLNFNEITDIGANALAEVIPYLPQGVEIDLSLHKISSEGNKLLVKALLKSTSLTKLDMGFSVTDSEIIELCCERNKLVRDYPQHEQLIKKLSHEKSLYSFDVSLRQSEKKRCRILIKNSNLKQKYLLQ